MAKIAKLSDSLPLTEAQQSQLAAKVENYRAGVQKLHDDYWTGSGYTFNPGSVAVAKDGGSRFIRIELIERQWRDQSDHSKGEIELDKTSRGQIHTFLDKITGDVLKPASWKAPAKIARGNLFDEHNGLRTVDHFGPGYLRR